MMDARFIKYDTTSCLAHVVEEMGEVATAIGKSQRWGLASVNPLLPPEQQETNGAWVVREMRDLRDAMARLFTALQAEGFTDGR